MQGQEIEDNAIHLLAVARKVLVFLSSMQCYNLQGNLDKELKTRLVIPQITLMNLTFLQCIYHLYWCISRSPV